MIAVIVLVCFIILMAIMMVVSILSDIHAEIKALNNTLIEIAYNIEAMRGEQK